MLAVVPLRQCLDPADGELCKKRHVGAIIEHYKHILNHFELVYDKKIYLILQVNSALITRVSQESIKRRASNDSTSAKKNHVPVMPVCNLKKIESSRSLSAAQY